ncbi:MAG: murein hydrolase activator EnvC [Actinomycetota bacterium]
MYTRSRRAPLAAALLLTLLVPAAVSSANPKHELHDTRRSLRTVRDRLDRHESKARSLKLSIADTNRAITTVQIALNELDSQIALVRAQVHGAETRIAATQTEIDALHEIATAQAVELYKAGSTETFDALLDAASISELNDRIELLGVAAQSSTGALVRYGRLLLRIEVQNRELFARRDELARSRSAHVEVLAERSRLRTDLAADLAALDRRIGREKTREGHLEAAAGALRDKIVEAQARSAVEALGMSSEGFIWPLNGPVTSPFGPRWGSTHTGIDIDGYTGQPVVAAKSGRVIYLGAGMTGYGNTVVLDHGGGLSTLYAHMSGYATTNGAGVEQGAIVGYVGCTGNCYGDHLHFEVRRGGAPVNPLDYLP